MTPEDDRPDDRLPELTPEQESEVRRLLAEARHDEPVPADVADRLDTVLAGLPRDEPGSPGVAPVIDLAARRRRRNAAAVLAGAAAVIVAGFAIGQVIDVGSDDAGGGGSSAAGSARSGSHQGKSQRASPTVPDGADAAPGSAPPTLVLDSVNLERDLTDQLGGARTFTNEGSDSSTFEVAGCPAPAPASKYGLGDLFPALFDGEPAVVALRPPANGKQRADVLACSSAATLATATIPATH
jgi:hypothetical protein